MADFGQVGKGGGVQAGTAPVNQVGANRGQVGNGGSVNTASGAADLRAPLPRNQLAGALSKPSLMGTLSRPSLKATLTPQ